MMDSHLHPYGAPKGESKNSIQPGSVYRRLLVSIPLLLVLCWCTWHAISAGLASLQVLRVEKALKWFDRNGVTDNASEIQAAFGALASAIALHPKNPYQLTLKARLLEWRGLIWWRENAVDSGEDFRAAIELHRQAAIQRPLWPESWAEMAMLKVRLGEHDDELGRFIWQANRLGPYIDMVHVAVVQSGMEKLRRDPFAEVPLLQKHTLRGLLNPGSREAVLRLVEQHGQQVMVCRWISLSEVSVSPEELCY